MKTIAMYLRLSSEDSYDGESLSIQNQRDLLQNHIKNHAEFASWNIVEFNDDGYSGTNFDRPGIQEMLGLIGVSIDCIIVKDFSRFGRNLIEVGNYLDQIFPFFGVRFIAVNENFDSNNGRGSTISLDVSLKTLMYEMYSRDISEKVKSVQEAKFKKGEYLCTVAPYGFKKSETQKNKLEVDPDTAPIIQRIFGMAAGGTTATKIAVILNDEGVLSPLMHRKSNDTIDVRSWNVAGNQTFWTRANVRKIIVDERYTGRLLSRKRTRVDFSTKRTRAIPEGEWIVAEDAHEAIVPKALFEQAQSVISSSLVTRTQPPPPTELLRGLIKCAECGRTLRKMRCMEPYFKCPTATAMTDCACKKIRVTHSEITAILLSAINIQVQLAGRLDSRPQEIVPKKSSTKQAVSRAQQAAQRGKTEAMLLFERFADGHISKEEYLVKKQVLNEKIAALTDKGAELAVKVEQEERQKPSVITEVAELTRELLVEFIQAVHIYADDRMEIVYNYSNLH